jgi:hypothetical protein
MLQSNKFAAQIKLMNEGVGFCKTSPLKLGFYEGSGLWFPTNP